MNILRSDTAEVNIHPSISINETLSKVSQLEALNIPQTPIVDQMVVLNTQKTQTTNELGRLKTLERPVKKLLETSDKPKIKQSQEAGASINFEESTALQENKENQKAKAVFPNSSGFVFKKVSVPFIELYNEQEKLPCSPKREHQNRKEMRLSTDQQVKKQKVVSITIVFLLMSDSSKKKVLFASIKTLKKWWQML